MDWQTKGFVIKFLIFEFGHWKRALANQKDITLFVDCRTRTFVINLSCPSNIWTGPETWKGYQIGGKYLWKRKGGEGAKRKSSLFYFKQRMMVKCYLTIIFYQQIQLIWRGRMMQHWWMFEKQSHGSECTQFLDTFQAGLDFVLPQFQLCIDCHSSNFHPLLIATSIQFISQKHCHIWR